MSAAKFKDIDLLSHRTSILGTEKIPVSSEEFITMGQIYDGYDSTVLLDLTNAKYQAAALQVAAKLSKGEYVNISLKVSNDLPLRSVTQINKGNNTYLLFTSALISNKDAGGDILNISQLYYLLDCTDGSISEEKQKVSPDIALGGKTHMHSNKADLDTITVDAEDYINITQRHAGATIPEKRKAKVGKADDATTWAAHKFEDIIDQPLRRADNVDFAKVKANDVVVQNGVTSDDFVAGGFSGAGFAIYEDANKQRVLEIDKIIARRSLDVNEVIINQISHVGGKTIYSAANMECTRVKILANAYRCFMDTHNGQRANLYAAGDQAYCQRFDANNTNIVKYYWRLVTEVGVDYIDLSKTDADGTGMPAEGDQIVQIGNRTVAQRQTMLEINQLTGGTVVQYAGINGYSFVGKECVGFGYDAKTGDAKLFCFGDTYIGDRDIHAADSQFMTFQRAAGSAARTLHIKADVSLSQNSSGLGNLSEFKDLTQTVENIPKYELRLSSENASVACTTTGVPIDFGRITTQATVVKGSSNDTGWVFTAQFIGCTGDVTKSEVGVYAVSADNASVVVTATKAELSTLTKTLTITKVRQGVEGDPAYAVEILSSSGTTTINHNIDLTLTARVLCGGEDVTDTISKGYYSWLRISPNTQTDQIWNKQHEGLGKSIRIGNSDVVRSALFECVVTINGTTYHSN